jgi:hypothetical protein
MAFPQRKERPGIQIKRIMGKRKKIAVMITVLTAKIRGIIFKDILLSLDQITHVIKRSFCFAG